ncbi:FISUMP domain-containing protein [Sunxiuqinia sp. A32]|uniref:FISUMP domain-containing protein n=1 Tax=Sunxiuqinia sp. A32 TaxID=3461496 RepID=UPI0040468534
MKYYILFFSFFLSTSLVAQDLIYTVSGDYNDEKIPLDSIIVDNVTNGESISFVDLPEHDYYQINLSKNAYWGTVSVFDLQEISNFVVQKNIPGQLSVLYSGSLPIDVTISIVNINGQSLFRKNNISIRPQNSLKVNLGTEGLCFVKIESTEETKTLKVIGRAEQSNFSVEINDNFYRKSIYSSTLKSTTRIGEGDFTYDKGDSIRIWAFRNGIYAWPKHMRIHESEDIGFLFEDIDYSNLNVQAYPDSIGKETKFIWNEDTLICNLIDGEYVFQGDIILSENQVESYRLKGASRSNLPLWTNGIVYYVISDDLIGDKRIDQAIEYWNLNTSVDFVKRYDEKNYVSFVKGRNEDTGSSNLGMVGGKQEIKIGSNLESGDIIHEMGHAIGLIHEHCRSDRDAYVSILKENIELFKMPNFWKVSSSINKGNFDFNSIMLYGSHAFSKNDEPTILKLDGTEYRAQHSYLSVNDIDLIDYLYGGSAAKRPLVKVKYADIEFENYFYITGEVINQGDAPIERKAIVWRRLSDSNYNYELFDAEATNFNVKINDPAGCEEYIFYATATNAFGTATSEIKARNILPFMELSVSEVEANSAKIICKVEECDCINWVKIGVYDNADNLQGKIGELKIEDQKNQYEYSVDFLEADKTYYARSSLESIERDGISSVIYSDALEFKTSKASLPSVTTNEISNIGSSVATSGGSIVSDGGSQIIKRGVCWSTSSSPTIYDTKTSDGSGLGQFISNLVGLKPNTEYYVRAYATNIVGTAYGSQKQFETSMAQFPPTVETNDATSVTETSAYLNGAVTSDGGSSIIQRGFYWSKTDNTPDIDDNIEIVSGTVGTSSKIISGLEPSTTYYFTMFAKNSEGVSTGSIKSFKTSEAQIVTGTLTDIDGNVYKTVKIGNQWWMAENLKTTKYRDGSIIANKESNSEWANSTTGAYSYSSNTYKETYGLLYNWYAANTSTLAPEGWHVPSNAEWSELQNYLADNGYNYDGSIGGGNDKIGKALASESDWTNSTIIGSIGNNQSENNRSGFSGLPGGWRLSDGSYQVDSGTYGCWWSKGEYDGYTFLNALRYDNEQLYRHISNLSGAKVVGYNVRCVKD